MEIRRISVDKPIADTMKIRVLKCDAYQYTSCDAIKRVTGRANKDQDLVLTRQLLMNLLNLPLHKLSVLPELMSVAVPSIHGHC